MGTGLVVMSYVTCGQRGVAVVWGLNQNQIIGIFASQVKHLTIILPKMIKP